MDKRRSPYYSDQFSLDLMLAVLSGFYCVVFIITGSLTMEGEQLLLPTNGQQPLLLPFDCFLGGDVHGLDSKILTQKIKNNNNSTYLIVPSWLKLL